MRDAMQELLGGLAEDLRLAAEAGRPHVISTDLAPILQLAFEGALGRHRDLERRLREAELARGLAVAELETVRLERETARGTPTDVPARRAAAGPLRDPGAVVVAWPVVPRRRQVPIASAEDRA